MTCSMLPFPVYKELQAEVDKPHTHLFVHHLEHDKLLNVEYRNIEVALCLPSAD